MSHFDIRSFRSALGRFATGVTIITARGANGEAVGITANSFNSVSLDPPLVLWSLDRSSNSRSAFESSDEFAIHVIGLDQEHLSNKFAKRGADKFEGMEIGTEGAPIIDGCAALFRCRKVQRHDVGDHILFIGEVVEFNTRDCEPLLFLHGSYGEARRKDITGLGADLQTTDPHKSLITLLLFQAHVRVMGLIRDRFDAVGLEQPEPIVLAALVDGLSTLQDIARFVADRNFEFSENVRDALVRRELIAINGEQVEILPAGRTIYSKLLDSLRQVEERFIAEFTPGELQEGRHFLTKFGNSGRAQ